MNNLAKLLVPAALAIMAVAPAQADTFVRMVSGPSGGSWYPLGAKIMQVMEKNNLPPSKYLKTRLPIKKSESTAPHLFNLYNERLRTIFEDVTKLKIAFRIDQPIILL